MNDKDTLLKAILSIRRKRRVPQNTGRIEIERFEEQVEKSLRRIEQERYLAKKFNVKELEEVLKAYEEVTTRQE